jgi:ATP-dependent RNA helicase RhlE
MHTLPISSPTSSPISSFSHFSLLESLQKAVTAEGYERPTPIQVQAIPHLLQGRDLLGCAQTGTGKTAAFALPVLDRLARAPRPAGARGPRALVLTPTRELALQVAESFRTYGRHVRVSCATVFGGVGQQSQVDAIRRGADVVVATPGRLIDLMEQRLIRFDALSVLVLDEADRMLDMGFIRPIRQILAVLPRVRQNMLFSATMPPDIAELAASLLTNPEKVAVDPVATAAERVEQSVLFVSPGDKRSLLLEVLRGPELQKVLVFTRTKHGANRVADHLVKAGVSAEAIHGNKSQNARQRALHGFKQGHLRVLVATDIAARGIDVDGVTHVINYELPNEPESYVHRIGRTGRAGAAGIALSFCDHEERASLRSIERLTRSQVRVVDDHPFAASANNGRADRTSPTGAPEGQDPRRRGGRTYYSSRSGPPRRHRRS